MLAQSDMAHIVRSSDEGNSRKNRVKPIIIFNLRELAAVWFHSGAINANKNAFVFLSLSCSRIEIDAWPEIVWIEDGDPDKLMMTVASACWGTSKDFRGSTPLIKGSSKIEKSILARGGDQRKYHVLCKKCSFPQERNCDGVRRMWGGFKWDMDEDGIFKT